jgi:predicted nucleic acid-binding protein
VILLDAYPLIALLGRENVATQVSELLQGGEPVAVAATALTEAYDHLVRIARLDPTDIAFEIAELGFESVPQLTEGIATRAGLLRAHHYHRTARPVSLADCIAAETARDLDARLATSDSHLLDMCAEEGIEVIPLPDSRGVVWQRM